MKSIAHHAYDSWKLALERAGTAKDSNGFPVRSWYELTPSEREVWHQVADAVVSEVAEAHK